MYLGLIHVANANHEHQHPAEQGEGHRGSVLAQMVQWLGRIFRGGSIRVAHKKMPTKGD